MLSSPPPLLPPKLSCLSSLLVTNLPWPILFSLRFGGSTTGAASFSCLAFSSSLALFLALSVGMSTTQVSRTAASPGRRSADRNLSTRRE